MIKRLDSKYEKKVIDYLNIEKEINTFNLQELKNYGFDVADRIKESILTMCAKDKEHIYENYDAKTEKGLCCDHFSWSCVFVIEFILNFEKHI